VEGRFLKQQLCPLSILERLRARKGKRIIATAWQAPPYASASRGGNKAEDRRPRHQRLSRIRAIGSALPSSGEVHSRVNSKRLSRASLFVLIENRVYGLPKQVSYSKRERQRRVMLSVLDGIHRLTRDGEPLT
jgi:hypothetical protein